MAHQLHQNRPSGGIRVTEEQGGGGGHSSFKVGWGYDDHCNQHHHFRSANKLPPPVQRPVWFEDADGNAILPLDAFSGVDLSSVLTVELDLGTLGIEVGDLSKGELELIWWQHFMAACG